MPTPEELEVADLLLGKADSDLSAARALASHSGQQDDVIGFHAQQAVEKSLKAVLAMRSLEIPRTHDIELLIRRLQVGPDQPPDELIAAKTLSPWAVTMRYDEMETTLDREAALDLAEQSLEWARAQVEAVRHGI